MRTYVNVVGGLWKIPGAFAKMVSNPGALSIVAQTYDQMNIAERWLSGERATEWRQIR
jgi:hypothetical protein